MPINHDREALRASSGIKRWGAAAKLSRAGILRDCIAGILDYNPTSKGLNLDDAARVRVAAPLAIPPDHELDKLIFKGAVYQITSPVKGARPGGVAYFYDLDVLYESIAT